MSTESNKDIVLRYFPDKHFTIEDVVAEHDRALLRWTIRGTHVGEFWTPVGTAFPTGNQITLTTMALFRVADGKSSKSKPSLIGSRCSCSLVLR